MAMPASGSIGIITCPNGIACSSIAQAVDGNVTPPKSLTTLSVSAGKSAPHSMLEFYNYAQITWKCVDYCIYDEVGYEGGPYDGKCVCLTYNPAIAAGDCYYLQLDVTLCAINSSFGYADFGVYCNSTNIYYCCVDDIESFANASVSFGIDSNDDVQIKIGACDVSGFYQNYATLQPKTISQCAGSSSSFCDGSGISIVCAYTTYV